MNININADWKLIQRLVVAVETLVTFYASVHYQELHVARVAKDPVATDVGKTYYQSDQAIWEAEQEEKRKKEVESGAAYE